MIDLLIIGAGPSGLCAAKTFLEYDPSADIVIVEAQSCLGGVWSKEQIYPTLQTNNLFSAIDFTDFPMDESFGIQPGQHVTGEAMNAYLCAYADHFALTSRIRFATRVLGVSRIGDGAGWDVRVSCQDKPIHQLQCRKLIVATGVLSVPHMPQLDGAEEFDAPYIHSSELGPKSDIFLKDPSVHTVAVLGGGKSAYDAVYLAASTGHKVEWIIRKSGRGPVWVFPTHTFLGPFKAWRERLVTRRILSFMSPCVFPDFSGLSWLKNFLHFNSLGRAISTKFWSLIHADTLRDCRYREEPCLNILEPEQNPFWYGTASGTLNNGKDFTSFIKSGQVKIHRQDIDHLSKETVHLGDGSELAVDSLVASTGFSAKPRVSFEPPSLHSDLGLPTTDLDSTQEQFWAQQDAQADVAIGTQYPRLLVGPHKSPGSESPKEFNPGMSAEAKYTPWRLYRGVAPPGLTAAGDHSLVFIGMFSNIANTIRLEVQCLWALAYLNGKLASVDQDVRDGRIFQEAATFQRFTQHRAPYGHGRFYPDLVFDQLPYWDMLLHDLGLQTRRKSGVLREIFEPYTQADYRGLTQEWIERNR